MPGWLWSFPARGSFNNRIELARILVADDFVIIGRQLSQLPQEADGSFVVSKINRSLAPCWSDCVLTFEIGHPDSSASGTL